MSGKWLGKRELQRMSVMAKGFSGRVTGGDLEVLAPVEESTPEALIIESNDVRLRL
jgi:hypothetical protein